MAVQPRRSSQQINPFLSFDQRELLLMALNSQAASKQVTGITGATNRTASDTAKEESATMNAGTMFQSPGNIDNFNGDFTPDLDYLDGDNSFDFENADLGGEMIGALPGRGEQHDKRSHPEEEDDDVEEGDSKRQEGEKGAKKPGRKPLTSEPTTKRKAQNRAAQRAFRERKEKHLKDLETKVTEMSKTHEADKHENGMLKAQIDRLQTELREYRKRLSLNAGSVSRSPPQAPQGTQSRSNTGSAYDQGNFRFDFPKFGALPGSQIISNQNGSASTVSSQRNSITPPMMTQSPGTNDSIGDGQPPMFNRVNSSNSTGRGVSPRSVQGAGSAAANPAKSRSQQNSFSHINLDFAPYSTNDNMHGFASTLPQMDSNNGDPFGDLFSPSIMKTVGQKDNYFNSTQPTSGAPKVAVKNGGESTAGIPDNRVFRFNSTSNTSDSASPSASSLSQWNMNGTTNSSCGTSPEPVHDSPANKDKSADNFEITLAQNNTYTDNAWSQLLSSNNLNSFATNPDNSNNAFSVPQLDSFDPVLFGGYRESHSNILSGGDFGGGFFDEALNSTAPHDCGSPSNLFGILQNLPQPDLSPNGAVNALTPSRNLMAEIDKTRDGGDDDYGLSNTQQQQTQSRTTKKVEPSKLISCNNIWNQLQSNPDFQDGKIDLDGLCSELRSKARCSESGVMVDQDHVDRALKKLGKKDGAGKIKNVPPLMFEQESWDKVLKKLGGGQ